MTAIRPGDEVEIMATYPHPSFQGFRALVMPEEHVSLDAEHQGGLNPGYVWLLPLHDRPGNGSRLALMVDIKYLKVIRRAAPTRDPESLEAWLSA